MDAEISRRWPGQASEGRNQPSGCGKKVAKRPITSPMPRLQSSMQSLAFNQIASPRQTQFSLLRQPPPHRSTVRLLHFQLLSRRSRASWRPSAKHQCFATFILAAFKTSQYPCGFARSRRTQKHPFLPPIYPQTGNFTSKHQRFAAFNLAAFKTAQ